MVPVSSVHLETKIESGSDRKSERVRVRERESDRERKEEGVTFPSQGPHGQCV